MRSFVSMAFIWMFLTGAAISAAAQEADVAGASDHPLIPRYEGSQIVKYETLSFAAYPLIIGPIEDERDGEVKPAGSILDLEGKLTRLTYRAPARRSVLEVFRNYQQALADAGFETIFNCAGDDCGSDFADFAERDRSMSIWGDGRSHRYLSARLKRNQGDVYVSLYTTRNASGGPSKDRAMVQLDVVEIEPMEEKMVVLDAGALQSEIATDGRVAVYGILFDFDKAEIRPDSKPQLDEIAVFLKSNPELEVLIVGHTDAKGGLDYNRKLSELRARAVVEALTSGYGIDAGRLTPVGVGMAAPVANNRTEEGRAKNRRVEIVELL